MDSDEPLYLVTYTGSDVVTLGKAGTFQNGTTVYVREADANAAKAMGHFSVSGPYRNLPGVERRTSKESLATDDAARASAKPVAPPEPKKEAPKPAPVEAKKDEKPAAEKKP